MLFCQAVQLATCILQISSVDKNCRNTGWAKKTGLFLKVDNFSTVSGSEACDVLKVFKYLISLTSKFFVHIVRISVDKINKLVAVESSLQGSKNSSD